MQQGNQGMMGGQPNQMQNIRPGPFPTNAGPRMAAPMNTGIVASQHSVQQRQQFQQHGTMQSPNTQQTPISTSSILSSTLNTSNSTNVNPTTNSPNNMNNMGNTVGSPAGKVSNAANNIMPNPLQQTPATGGNMPSNTSTLNNGATTGQQQQPVTPPNPINTATVCKIGQETVQEIVGRTQEVFSYLKSLQPPVGNADKDKINLEKQQRLQEVLRGITHLFKRLTFCWNKAQEHGLGGMEYAQLESLIPLKDDYRPCDGMKLELEKKRGDAYRQALEENNELSQTLVLKNRQLKEIIDQIRNIIWEINTMLAMR